MMNETGVVPFYEGGLRRRQWSFYTRDETLLASSLVGRTVNIGTKDGLVYDSAKVTGFDDRKGILTVEGGVHQDYAGDPQPTGTDEVVVWDIARGYIHGEPEEQSDRVA